MPLKRKENMYVCISVCVVIMRLNICECVSLIALVPGFTDFVSS